MILDLKKWESDYNRFKKLSDRDFGSFNDDLIHYQSLKSQINREYMDIVRKIDVLEEKISRLERYLVINPDSRFQEKMEKIQEEMAILVKSYMGLDAVMEKYSLGEYEETK